MNSLATQIQMHFPSESTPLRVSAPLDPVATVKRSFAYRARLWMTGVSLGVGVFLAMATRPLAPFSAPVEWTLELLGWAVFFSGAVIRVWSSSHICARKSRDVVRTGPYSVCRNPLYWGTFLMVAAFPLLLRSPILAVCMLPPILLYLLAVVPVEEAVMASRHGDNYASYCRSVSRWWPNFLGYVKGEPLGCQTTGYRRECLGLIWWLGFAIGLDFLFLFENAAWWMHPLQS